MRLHKFSPPQVIRGREGVGAECRLASETLTLTLPRNTRGGERSNRHRGFWLMELMVAIPIIFLGGGIAVELMHSTLVVATRSQDVATTNNRIDSAIFQMRQDVWHCSAIQSDSGGAKLTIGSSQISWSVDPSGALIRTDSNGTAQRWESIAAGWQFASDPTCLMIRNDDQEMRLANQVLISQRAAQ
jgi:type II secretory pathway component PulJ